MNSRTNIEQVDVPEEVVNLWNNTVNLDKGQVGASWLKTEMENGEALYEVVRYSGTHLLRFSATVLDEETTFQNASAVPANLVEVRFIAGLAPVAVLPNGERVAITGRTAERLIRG